LELGLSFTSRLYQALPRWGWCRKKKKNREFSMGIFGENICLQAAPDVTLWADWRVTSYFFTVDQLVLHDIIKISGGYIANAVEWMEGHHITFSFL